LSLDDSSITGFALVLDVTGVVVLDSVVEGVTRVILWVVEKFVVLVREFNCNFECFSEISTSKFVELSTKICTHNASWNVSCFRMNLVLRQIFAHFFVNLN
jgi:hypothetical protein